MNFEINVSLRCCGCHEHATGKLSNPRTVVAKFSSAGDWGYYSLKLTVPEGWIAFDPYTNVTYCPKCWAEIETPEEAGVEESEIAIP